METFPFVVLSQTEQKPLTYRTLKYVSINNILSRLTNPWYLVDLLSLYNSTSSFYKQVKCFSKYPKNLKRRDKIYVPRVSGLKHPRSVCTVQTVVLKIFLKFTYEDCPC